MKVDAAPLDLVGPLHADAIEQKKLIEQYVSIKGEFETRRDPFISPILSGNKIILSGVRGTGKTMILKTADEILQSDIKHKLLELYEYELTEDDKKLMPVYISYSGFKNDVSLQNESELNPDEIRLAREIFRGYFFMSLLQKLLEMINKIGLDENVDFNLFGLRTKFGIKREVDKAIETFKRLGFKEILNSKKKGFDIGIKIKAIELKIPPQFANETATKEVTLDDLQKTDLFKTTIDSICKTYKIDKVVFLFDEVHYLKFLQREFFDILFGFRNYNRVSFCISAYPTYMDYGGNFDIPDDAQEISVSSTIYKPTKDEYERPFSKFVQMRLEKYGDKNIEDVISDTGLELLILLTNGNPRILLQSIDYVWRKNNCKKVNVSSITQDLIFEMVDNWYLQFMENQAKRFKTDITRVNEFLSLIKDRLSDYNNRNTNPTIFFLVNDEIYNHFTDTINLLHYSRIIDKVKISSFGSSAGKKGRMFLLNPMVGWYYGIFTKIQIPNLPKLIKESLDKDNKIQFDSLQLILNRIVGNNKCSCPRYRDDVCSDPKCGVTYNEQWTICPFYPGVSLELNISLPDDVDIHVLGLSERMSARLKNGGMRTLKDILNAGIEGLQTISQIGQVRSNNIYYAAKEYVDDNL
ncbi:MAG: hypothetical protein H6Q69_1957 [Firmicutes bacterium]|nr:hypothetical protein [Bacillota bacterium]